MPIKSKAQRRKFAQLLVEGKISPQTFEEWNRSAGDVELPERLHPKVAPKKRAPKRKRRIKVKPKRVSKAKATRSVKKSRPARKRG
jgi:hypothetical protein